MRPHIEELSEIASCYTSAYPNAGLPNAFGEYDEQPHETAHIIEEWAQRRICKYCWRLLRHYARSYKTYRTTGEEI